MRLIDGDALDEFLQKAEIDAEKAKKYVLRSAINTIRGNLANFPTVEPERKKGRWEKKAQYHGDDTSGFTEWGYCCSECGELALIAPGFYLTYLSDYCPNCGADMRGEA